MKLLILLQVLITTIHICKPDDEPNTTIILHDTRTEMTVEQVNNKSRSKANEFFDSLRESEDDGNDLDFDYDEDQDVIKDIQDTEDKEQEMQEVLLKAMRKPAIRKQIGEVIPILRVMSPAQRLTLAALVSSQIMSQNTPSESNLTEMAAIFAGKNVENADDHHNLTEHLLLPISMDIAKMFKGLGQEMGRNLRESLYRPQDPATLENKFRKFIKNNRNRIPSPTPNRRMDEMYFEESEKVLPENLKPKAEALKQPGKDECDYFTKNLCLEVSNYPTEAIISSLKKNQNIAKTFLTDFDIPANEGRMENQGTGRRLERRQDGQNNIQDLEPEGSYMCPSSVKYARPKRARTTSGQWKYIVNAGDYTQTLRLEICQKPKSPCSYVTNHLNSQCAQVFNYHRLLTWDEGKGLHMDIFKVPSCCSCHIQGYSNFFPPNKDFTYADKRREPLEPSEVVPQVPNRPPYTTVGNKREVSKPVPLGPPPTIQIRNTPNFIINYKEFAQNPVDHLVPPGPPLPLENEGIFNPQLEEIYSPKKEIADHNRRYPSPTENTRVIPKATERIEINEPPLELTIPGKTRIKAPVQPQKAKIPQIHHPAVISSGPQEQNLIFDPASQIQFLRPSPPPIPFPKPEIQRGKPSEGGLFVTPNPKPDLIITSPPKTHPRQPVQFFKPELNDIKSLPSRVSPFYVTPPKEIEIRATTTSSPIKKSELLSASGQKKINYNYHPIIDFFIADSKKRQPTYSAPPYLPLSSGEWTPVLGH